MSMRVDNRVALARLRTLTTYCMQRAGDFAKAGDDTHTEVYEDLYLYLKHIESHLKQQEEVYDGP